MAFPTTLQNPKADWNGTDQPVGHSSHHNVMATLLIALQTKLGIDGSTDVNSVDYKLAKAIKAVADEVHISAALAGGGFFVETAMQVSSYLSVIGGGASLFQLQSAGYGAGKVLMSDANGNANWSTLNYNIPMTGGNFIFDVNAGIQARIYGNGTTPSLWIGFTGGITLNNDTSVVGTLTGTGHLKGSALTLRTGGFDRMNWNQYDAGSAARRIYMAVYDQSGNWLGNPIEVDNFPAGEGTREIRLTADRIKLNGVATDQYVKNTLSTVNAQTGTTYTFALVDSFSLVTLNNASAITATVPPNSSVAFPIGTQIDICQLGAGKVIIAQGAGVTINSKGGNKALSAQYVAGTLKKIATDTWLLFGDLIA